MVQSLISHYGLRQNANACPQTYALGIKEVWEVPEEVSASAAALRRTSLLLACMHAVICSMVQQGGGGGVHAHTLPRDTIARSDVGW